jgi:hypothetical protein
MLSSGMRRRVHPVSRRFGATSVHTGSTRRHIPEDGVLQLLHCLHESLYVTVGFAKRVIQNVVMQLHPKIRGLISNASAYPLSRTSNGTIQEIPSSYGTAD